jgi:hypothetical protein
MPWMVALFLVDRNRPSQGFFRACILPQGGEESKGEIIGDYPHLGKTSPCR